MILANRPNLHLFFPILCSTFINHYRNLLNGWISRMSDLFSAPEKECCDGKGKVLSLIKGETTRFTLLCSFIVCFHVITNQFHLFLTYH